MLTELPASTKFLEGRSGEGTGELVAAARTQTAHIKSGLAPGVCVPSLASVVLPAERNLKGKEKILDSRPREKHQGTGTREDRLLQLLMSWRRLQESCLDSDIHPAWRSCLKIKELMSPTPSTLFCLHHSYLFSSQPEKDAMNIPFAPKGREELEASGFSQSW